MGPMARQRGWRHLLECRYRFVREQLTERYDRLVKAVKRAALGPRSSAKSLTRE
jgi:hypothetical protein